jgi:O-methyltransferase
MVNGAREEMLERGSGGLCTSIYFELLKGILTRSLVHQNYRSLSPRKPYRLALRKLLTGILGPFGLEIVKPCAFDPDLREHGLDWPDDAETMVGLRRLDNIQTCVEGVLRESIPGDLIETGVWRGGSAIFMRAILKAHDVRDRTVWLADSFKGLPEPDPQYAEDKGDVLHTYEQLCVSLQDVKDNFTRYGLLDEQVRFLVGWFADTLPTAPIDRLAVLRLDGDMYGSTMDALRSLYDKLSPGGYVIVDDYGVVKGCRAAVDEFRTDRGIDTEPTVIDRSGAVYWKKSS